MSSVFSAISGVFGRAMIIGALLPSTLFVLFGYLVLVPMLPWEWRVVVRLEALETEWKLAAVAALAVVLAGVLDVLNVPIVRFYEGYPWQHGLLGKFMVWRQKRIFDAKQQRRKHAETLLDQTSHRTADLYGIDDAVRREMMAVYPPRRDDLLPTRLGNVVRSFEEYPRRQYGISGVVLWPRFLSRITEAHAKQIDDARTSFNVAIHLSFLALLAAVLMLASGLVYPIPFVSWNLTWPWIGRIVAAGAIAWLMYEASISRAQWWGATVRAAFDLHRAAVLKDLGVTPQPRDLRSERSVWIRLSQQIIFGDPDVGPTFRFDVSTLVFPEYDELVVARVIATTKDANVREVSVRVENRSASPVQDVQIVEHLPAGTELVTGSMSHPVDGTNPYWFTLGNLGGGQASVLTYRILAGRAS